MTDQPETPQPRITHTPDFDTAVGNAARIFTFAEDDLANLDRMEKLTILGQAWVNLASLLDDHQE